MFRLIITAFIALFTSSCSGPRYVDYFPYNDDGTQKPKVAILPIVDSTGCRLDWSLSEEVSEGLYYEFMNSGRFYVPSPGEIGPAWGKAVAQDSIFSDLSFTQGFRNTDFAVVLELVDRIVTPCEECQTSSKTSGALLTSNRTLTTSVRIKVIDIRCAIPKIVLYEVFKSNYLTTLSRSEFDGKGACWGTPAYEKTCCGLAHQRLIKALAVRIEEAIWRVK